MPATTKAEILKRWPAGGFSELYGMTEGGVGCTLRAHEHPDKLDTVGVPNPGVEMFVIDEAGHVLPQGQVGELVGRSRSMMSGYYGREKAPRRRVGLTLRVGDSREVATTAGSMPMVFCICSIARRT